MILCFERLKECVHATSSLLGYVEEAPPTGSSCG